MPSSSSVIVRFRIRCPIPLIVACAPFHARAGLSEGQFCLPIRHFFSKYSNHVHRLASRICFPSLAPSLFAVPCGFPGHRSVARLRLSAPPRLSCPRRTVRPAPFWDPSGSTPSGVSSSHSASRPLVPSPIFATTACRMSGARVFATATSYTSRHRCPFIRGWPRFTRSTHLPSTFPDNTSSTVPHWTAVPDTLAVGFLRHAMWSLPAIENVTPWIVPSTSPLAPPPVRASPTLSIRAVARSSSAVPRFAISRSTRRDRCPSTHDGATASPTSSHQRGPSSRGQSHGAGTR